MVPERRNEYSVIRRSEGDESQQNSPYLYFTEQP
jgi:hypothetical protein